MFKKKPFIVFEGIEGSGKSIHSKFLCKELKKRKIPYIYLREPGGSLISEEIRKIILNRKNYQTDQFTDTLLYLAARNENVKKNIIPSYHKTIIICDRFIDSTIAYQHYGFGINKKIIQILNNKILGKIKPDFTFLMKIKVQNSINRIKKRKKINKYDEFTNKFYNKVQNGFIKLSIKNKRKYLIVNSNKSINKNKKTILTKVKQLLI